MRVLFPSLFFAAIAVAEVLSLDSLPLDDTSLLWENQDFTSGQLDASDPTSGQLDFSDSSLLTAYDLNAPESDLSSFMTVASSDSPELELSSCTTETSDPQSWSKVRARGACSESGQSLSLQDDWLTDLGDKFKEMLGVTPDDEKDFRPSFSNQMTDETKCYPDYKYNLCCLTQDSFHVRTFMGQEITKYYDYCDSGKFIQAGFWSNTSCQLIYDHLAAGCLNFEVCCRAAVFFIKGVLTGVECYQVSRLLPFEHFNPPSN